MAGIAEQRKPGFRILPGVAVKRIVSRDNPHFRRLSRLARSAKARRSSGQMLLDGVHLVDAYTAAFGVADLQLFARGSAEEGAIARLSGAPTLDPIILSEALFDEIAPVETPTGLLALAPIPEAASIIGRDQGFSLFLDGIQDPGNLGAILRSAAAAGGQQAFLSAQCADPWSPKCLRGGMGAQFHLVLQDRVELAEAASSYTGRLVAADSRGEHCLFRADLGGDIGFIVGGEGQGISAALLALATERVRIPMAEGIESLNAAAAATLMFYEWRRRREKPHHPRPSADPSS